MKAPENRVYEFGPYRLNPAEGVLLREGTEVPLTPKSYEILVCLLHHAGHILEKDELMQEVWPDTFVEEGNLKVNISALRKALGDTTEESAFIETIPRRGYRFVAPVRATAGVPSRPVPAGSTQVTFERRKLERTVQEEEEIIEGPEPVVTGPPAVPTAVRPARRVGFWWAAAGTAVLALAVLVLLARPTLHLQKAGRGAVVRVTYSGGRLQAWDEENQLAWSHEFQEPVETPQTSNHNVLFADLAGDGGREMVVVVAFQRAGGVYPPINTVACFSPRGELLWSYQPQMSLSFGGREYKGPWVVRDVLASPDPQRRGVWVAYSHHTWWPSFLVHINAQGVAEMRFVNSGHITALETVTNALGSFILAGALNNEFDGAAVLAILRIDQPFAASPQSPGTQYWCDQCSEDRPFRYYLFPRSEINRLESQGYNPMDSINPSGGQILVMTNELPKSGAVGYRAVYSLNSSFDLTEAGFSDAYWVRHDQLRKEGRLDHAAADCPERKRIAVRLWDPEKGWREPAIEVAGSK